METLPPTAPHYYGLFAALALAALAAVALSRPTLARKRRALALGLAPLLVALAFFGSGVYGNAGRGQAFSALRMHASLPYDEALVERARDVALSPRFLAYHALLQREPLAFTPASLAARVRWRWEPDRSAVLRTPLPAAPHGVRALRYEYLDTTNAWLGMLGVGAREREQRRRFLDRLVGEYLIDLVHVEHLRAASDEPARVAALRALRIHVPMSAEWILEALAALEPRCTGADDRAALVETRAHVQRYVEDPTLRALPAGLRVRLP